MTTKANEPAIKRKGLSLKQFCYEYGCGRTKAYDLIRARQVESYLIGKKRLICAKSARRLKKQAIQEGAL